MALLKWSLVVVAIYLAAIVAFGVLQRRFLYFPDPRRVDPAEAGLSGVEELRLSTGDGETLIAWHAPPAQDRPLILYFHGNAANLADRAPRFRALIAHGYGLFAVSFRGYGGSTGSPTYQGLVQDGEAAYAAARARGYEATRIVAMGESLGTGVATVIAAAHPAAALVLDSPFSSLVDVAAAHYPIFPVRWLMLDRFRSDLAIGDVHMPLLVVHGDRDPVVPIQFARQLLERANEPKTFMSVRGGGHLVLGLADVLGRVQDWIDAATAANRR